MNHDHSPLHEKGTQLKHEGQKDHLVGTIKEFGGKLTGDQGMQIDGAVQKGIGKAEKVTGEFVEDLTK